MQILKARKFDNTQIVGQKNFALVETGS